MSRVLTLPGFGAFAIMTKVRFGGEKDSMRALYIGTYAARGVPILRRRK
jgi:hypothetical protein